MIELEAQLLNNYIDVTDSLILNFDSKNFDSLKEHTFRVPYTTETATLHISEKFGVLWPPPNCQISCFIKAQRHNSNNDIYINKKRSSDRQKKHWST